MRHSTKSAESGAIVLGTSAAERTALCFQGPLPRNWTGGTAARFDWSADGGEPNLAGEVSVMIVEDDPVFLNRFSHIIAAAEGFTLFAVVRDGAAARNCLAHGAPDVLLVDLGLPDFNGISIIDETSRRYPATDIMVVTVFGDETHVLSSIEAGATGYLLKDTLPEDFIGVIRELRAGGSPISPMIARQLLKKLRADETTAPVFDRPALSDRESTILSFLAKGFSFAEIAAILEISTHTVTTHVKKIYQKLAVHSRGEAVYEASKMGLIT